MLLDQPDRDRAEEEVFIFPASFAQQRLWFIEKLTAGDSLYIIPLLFRLSAASPTPIHQRLQQSLQTLVRRHETLRTTFEVIDGQLVQIIAPELLVSLNCVDLRTFQNRETLALVQIRQALEPPFSLNRVPLVRSQLWQLEDTEYLFLIALHHIIFDEWSSGVLIRELGQLYTAFAQGKPPALPELPIQYADFAHWQRQWLQGDVLNQQLAYWKQQLQDVPRLSLPGARLSPSDTEPSGS
uniref:Condensation domain-containing protein n=1 Tax=Desertifilum tharense IPPAS B-1220 TaxID=1781255 RepID=A0ACD5GXF4_9CYAN